MVHFVIEFVPLGQIDVPFIPQGGVPRDARDTLTLRRADTFNTRCCTLIMGVVKWSLWTWGEDSPPSIDHPRHEKHICQLELVVLAAGKSTSNSYFFPPPSFWKQADTCHATEISSGPLEIWGIMGCSSSNRSSWRFLFSPEVFPFVKDKSRFIFMSSSSVSMSLLRSLGSSFGFWSDLKWRKNMGHTRFSRAHPPHWLFSKSTIKMGPHRQQFSK